MVGTTGENSHGLLVATGWLYSFFFFFGGGEIVSVPGFSVNRFYIYKSPGVLAGHHR